MMVIWFMVTRNPNGISHEKIMINLDGLNGYNAIHGPWGKNSWPKAKIFRKSSISGAISRHWCHLCHVCLYAKIVHHREWVPTIALYLRCSCLGLECQRVLAERIEVLLTLPERKKLSGKMENFLSGLTHWNGPPLLGGQEAFEWDCKLRDWRAKLKRFRESFLTPLKPRRDLHGICTLS